MRPEEIVELVGNIANRSDIREAQSKQVQAIYDLLAVRERETWEAAAVAVGGSGGGRSAYSYRDEFLQNASLCIQVNQAGLNAPQTVPVASNSGLNGGRERADLPDTAEMLKEAYIVLNDVVHTAPGYNWNKDPLSLTLKVGDFNQKYYAWQKQSETTRPVTSAGGKDDS